MQSLLQNTQPVFYAQYSGKTDIIDSDGYKTGEKQKVYEAPVEKWMNVSASKGTAENDLFGISADYDRVMVTADTDCPITEETILWVDEPVTAPHDYKVTRVAKSLNSISYAIKKVDVTS